ncbi:DUF5667 domain-containing protein [Streptomyces lycii]|uniref:DUF5667 domain-containing protein n=1 Tax=Streptomyces lycii TaxID=2654337 RepID=A0ABQ7FSC1_9ACTN|nr:DUF5667 domain-containing protein [Streptomyces lycii]KAF4410543.1 hypothetical protein GCU69_03270 [Streptomyces lycii]
MIGSVPAHRRANAFADALDEQSREDGTARQPGQSADDPEQGRLLEVAAGLGEVPAPALDPEVKTVQRAQLVAAVESMFAEDGGPAGRPVPEQRSGRHAHRASPLHRLKPRSRWSKGIAAGGLTVGVAAGAFSGVAAASSDALPGDSLYGLKRGMENMELGFADDERDRGEIYLDQASTRLGEARRLMERGRSGSLDHESLGAVRRALSGMRHDAAEGHRLLRSAYERDGSLGPMQVLNSFSETHRSGWRALKDRLPVQLTDVSDEVTDVFDAIEDEVGPLKSLLPQPPGGDGRGGGDSGSGSSGPSGSEHTSQEPTPSRSDPSTDGSGRGDSPEPSETRQREDGLIGGAGDLLDPPESGGTLPSSPGGERDGTPAQPEITLPPVLPGLLPGLGISQEEAG